MPSSSNVFGNIIRFFFTLRREISIATLDSCYNQRVPSHSAHLQDHNVLWFQAKVSSTTFYTRRFGT